MRRPIRRSTFGAPGLPMTDSGQVRHVHTISARAGRAGTWPSWLPPDVVTACRQAGLEQPWLHQVAAAEAAHAGRHVVISTGTASGKTLGYLMPIMAATYGGSAVSAPTAGQSTRQRLLQPRRPHTALYLAPTKALAHDQLRVCAGFNLPDWKVTTLDGDSSVAERGWARDHATYLLSNPDMLHRSVLPSHARWAPVLQSLRYVVIDECHRYRGVFGAHVAAVLRRLRRLCAAYGAHPVFVLASATTTNAAQAAAKLIGVSGPEIALVSDDASPHGAVRMVLWQPDESSDDDAARLLAQSVADGHQTVAFIPSRKMAELVALRAARQLPRPGLRIDSYRSGYLPIERRALERDLQTGVLHGVAATNALELGVDVAGLDEVIISGFPGTLSALWQQAGRAGRTGADARVTLIARKDPLDAYLFDHPELIFAAPVEATVLDAGNPYVLAPHLAAAAQELPLTLSDRQWFGPEMVVLVDRLVAEGALRRRPQGWFWAHDERAVDAIDLRSIAGRSIEIVEAETGRVIGQVDRSAADRTVHLGAIYLHQGETYLVESLDHELAEAIVRPERPTYYTQPKSINDVRIVVEHQSRPIGTGTLHFGEVQVSSQVIGYLRRDELSGRVWDETPLDLPQRILRTHSVWWTLPVEVVTGLGLSAVQLAGAAHGVEHTAIGLLPMFTPCDRWDIGGLSTVVHPDTGCCTIFVHDGHPGGAGFAERGYAVADTWLPATLERLRDCACQLGCPACVVSPKCGNGNKPLDKAAARVLLQQWCGPV